MKIAVWGCGYLGAVHAAVLAELGHEVVGIEPHPVRAAALADGAVPFHEPGLEPLLSGGVRSGRLRFATEGSAAAGARLHFVCVGTPQGDDGAADLSQVAAAFDAIVPLLRAGDVVAGKSTVPVGTAARFAPAVRAAGGHLVWNPEFLREGTAVADSFTPDRVVVGADDDGGAAVELLAEVYRPMTDAGASWITCDLATAELAKVAANTFLAVKVSYANLLAEMCDASGADVTALRAVLAGDARIGGAFLGAGVGFGGGCLPKDVRGFAARAAELGVSGAVDLARVVDQANLRARARVVDQLTALLEGSGLRVAGSVVVVLGAAFKPDSDDMRDSPALAVADLLAARQAVVRVVDPQAPSTARWPVGRDPMAALNGADAVVLATDWAEYVDLDPAEAATVVRQRLAVDGRNRWDPARWRAAGFTYRGMGRR